MRKNLGSFLSILDTMSEKTSHASVPLRALCTVPAARGVMFLLLFDFLLLLLVFHALLAPDLGVGVPIPENQIKYEKPAAKLGLKAVLRTRDPNFFIPERIKKFKYFNQKNCF
jgi:hypothetical protein